MNTKTVILTVLVGVLFAASLVFFLNANDKAVAPATGANDSSSTASEPAERVLVYEAEGVLKDVSNSGSSGIATAEYYDDGSYELLAEFENLEELDDDFYYEGWLVNQTTSDFLSTGILEVDPQGSLVNNYLGEKDYQTEGYNFYVLTLEPDDGDPAPAKHIVEGLLLTEEN